MKNPPINPTFRAGWEAFRAVSQANGSRVGAVMEDEATLQAAWEAHCHVLPEKPHPLTPEAVVNDWNIVVANVSELAARYRLPAPDMIYHPKWLEFLNSVSDVRLSHVFVHMGVRMRFATFEQATVIREM